MRKNLLVFAMIGVLSLSANPTVHSAKLSNQQTIISDDEDGDGVPDEDDRCPHTPWGVPVGPDGCPLI